MGIYSFSSKTSSTSKTRTEAHGIESIAAFPYYQEQADKSDMVQSRMALVPTSQSSIIQLQQMADALQLKRSKKSGWNQKQIDQNQRLLERREERQQRYAEAREARRNSPIKIEGGDPDQDGYAQTWERGSIECRFSSGHGYRINHHKNGKPPSKNIRELGTMNQIEMAILDDLFQPGKIPKEGDGGTKEITIGGQKVEYRFKRHSVLKIGIGTYYRPD